MKIVVVAGARPNFIKIAPLMDALSLDSEFDPVLVHTGQHYDEQMSDLFFRQLEIREPDINLGVGSGSHASQTASIISSFEPILLKTMPKLVIVVGDVNSTIGCGLVAVKLGIPLAHIEAGLRSFDRSMPEEINRILTDTISDLLFCTEQNGVDNLRNSGIPKNKIFLVGNIMVDTLLKHKERADTSSILKTLGLSKSKYCTLTLHRPSNVDKHDSFSGILDALDHIQSDLPIIFPIHPRTRLKIQQTSLNIKISSMPDLRLIEPLGYLDFIKLCSSSKFIMTDSGGIQEESSILNIPCLTLRENTERPITVKLGTNRIVGTSTERIMSAYKELSSRNTLKSKIIPLWDGKATQRIINILRLNIS